MKSLRKILYTIAILLFCSRVAIAADYRIVLKGLTSGEYLLQGWHWGEKYSLDTVAASKGKAVFKGKNALDCGTYIICTKEGKRILEFVVPEQNNSFRAEYSIKGREITIKKGNPENRLYVEFQNLINWKWEEMGSKDKFLSALSGLQKKVAEQLPGSLMDIILTNNLFAPQTAEELQENFPFGNKIIANTNFAKEKVQQYLALLQYNHYGTVKEKVYELIESGEDRSLQGKLAHTAYEFFYNTKIMGQEGIAVEIARDWFLSNKLEWPNEEGKFMLRTFVEFNRHSLIGMDAPELNLQDTTGSTVPLRSMDTEYTIVYFYTDDCRSCREETPKLVDFVNGYSHGPLSVYAVYAESNPDKWKKYIEENLYIWHPFVNWVNVYDPDYSSGFQMLYNVMKTPQMFLLDKEMKIIGRGLSVESLKQLLDSRNNLRDRTRAFLEESFNSMADDTAGIREVINAVLEQNSNDAEGYKDFVWDSYATLGRSASYLLQEQAIWVAEKYILGRPDLWSAILADRVKEEVRRFNMNRLGEKAAQIALERADGSSILLEDVTNEYKVLYFYRPNCGMCSAVTPKMAKLYNGYKDKMDIEFIAINLGGSTREWIEYIGNCGADWTNVRGTDGDASGIYSAYWLQNIPAIYLLKDNIVVAKDINDIDLEEILNTLTK